MRLKLFLVLLLIPLVSAQENYNSYGSITLDNRITATVDLEGSGLQSLEADFYLNPKNDDHQKIIEKISSSTPSSEITEADFIKYKWTKEEQTYVMELNSKIETTNKLFLVPKINFPYESIPEELEEDLQEQEIIDITPEIIAKASEIVGSEDNAYLAVHKIAYWVRYNVDYNLNSLTEKSALKSSWVLESREGVCDEITNLFISMTRSIGIPARFVSGMAYTNVGDYFGNHGWAEVYYPGYGWVPYDVTYGQFGWVDPTHISFSKTVDTKGGSGVKYSWRSTNAEIIPKGIETSTEISSIGEKIEPIFDLSVTPLENELAPGSYVPIKVTIQNPYENYISTQVYITKAPELTSENDQVIALRPKEQKDIYWIVKLPDQAEEGFIYTTIVEAKDTFGSKDQDEIKFLTGEKKLSLEEAQEIIDELSEEEENSYSETLFLNCKPGKEYYYIFEESKVTCSLRSISSPLNNLEVCLNNEQCQKLSLEKLEEKSITFTKPASEILENSKITVTSQNLKLERYLNFKIFEKPSVKLTSLNYPSDINYNEDISLDIEITSLTPVKDAKLKINSLDTIELGDLDSKKSFSISLNSKAFFNEKIKVSIEYKDEFQNTYKESTISEIEINNTPWYMKAYGFIYNLF